MEEWFADEIACWAVVQRLATVGEAANRLSPELRARYNGVSWRRIIGFRNVAVHEYFSVEWQIVWQIVDQQLPELIEYAIGILRVEHPEVVAGLG